MSSKNGDSFELVVCDGLGRCRWTNIRHKEGPADILAVSPDDSLEWIIECKGWYGKSGQDFLKKALADARYLKLKGDPRPYMLAVSHPLPKWGPLLEDMATRALRAGDINAIRSFGMSL